MLTSLVLKPQITQEDRVHFLRAIDGGGAVDDAAFEALEAVARLPAERFIGDEVLDFDGSRQDILIRANNIARLRASELEVSSLVNDLSISWSKEVLAIPEIGHRGTWYARELALTIHAKRASIDGRVAFSYGAFMVDVAVRKGTALGVIARRVFDQVARDQGDYIERGVVPEAASRLGTRIATYLVHHC